MILVLTDFLKFLKKPVFIRTPDRRLTVKSFFLLFLLALPLTFILGTTGNIPFITNYLGVTGSLLKKHFDSQSLLANFAQGIILAPIAEEFIFRYFLNKFQDSCWFVLVNIYIILYNLLWLQSTSFEVVALLSVVVVAMVLKSKFRNDKSFQFRAYRWFTRNYYLFFYLSALGFGLIHLGNHQFSRERLVLPVVLVLPQVFGGLILGYLRVRYGIRWSILFHMLNNFVLIMPYLLF